MTTQIYISRDAAAQALGADETLAALQAAAQAGGAAQERRGFTLGTFVTGVLYGLQPEEFATLTQMCVVLHVYPFTPIALRHFER